jgi:DNA polymerase III epsilon subunit-like protein
MIKFDTIIKEMVQAPAPNEKILKWLLERINNTFIFFDTETTGFDREKNNQITQIGAVAVQLNGDSLKFFEVNRFNVKIKLNDDVIKQMETEPDEPEDEEEKKKWMFGTKKGILKYNHYDLVNSPNFEEERKALEMFDDFLKSHDDVLLFAHNAPFDMKWVEFHELFRESTLEVFDTLKFFSSVFFPSITKLACEFPDVYKKNLDKFPTVKSKDGEARPSSGLVNLCKGFDNSMNNLLSRSEGAHDAIVDCENTITVFQEGLNLIRAKIS